LFNRAKKLHNHHSGTACFTQRVIAKDYYTAHCLIMTIIIIQIFSFRQIRVEII